MTDNTEKVGEKSEKEAMERSSATINLVTLIQLAYWIPSFLISVFCYWWSGGIIYSASSHQPSMVFPWMILFTAGGIYLTVVTPLTNPIEILWFYIDRWFIFIPITITIKVKISLGIIIYFTIAIVI